MHERLSGGAARGAEGVHLGWHVRGRRVIAVKRLHPLHVADELALARIHAEAGLAMRIDHANVVATLGVVRHAGELVVAMEYVPSASLAEVMSASPDGLPPPIATAIAAGALLGIHAGHQVRAGVAARAMSPRRVLVAEDGRVRILGFDARGPAVVRVSELLDELPYASPEQLLRRGVDVRRDVYGMSVVLWETLTGRSLFQAPTVEGTLRKILEDDVPPPSRFAPDVGPELDAIVLRGLAREPKDRFESASAMAGALEGAASAPDEVARAIAGLELPPIRERRSLVEAVARREGARASVTPEAPEVPERRLLHIECNGGASKR